MFVVFVKRKHNYLRANYARDNEQREKPTHGRRCSDAPASSFYPVYGFVCFITSVFWYNVGIF